ncbi:hypothetical protein [Sphingomonas bacterium]|uniref:hypothetical protein n=1 Tax=Sphingomonas bacterium TaxID=1895847 RepID=UPI0015775672|nr:hypothetical protein [Sphingomonas bacterium]
MIPLVWLLAQAAPSPAKPAAPPPPVAAAPAWTPVERASAAGGTRSVSAAANAPGGRLVVRCDHAPDAVVSVQFIPRDPYRGFGVQPVSLRFDDGTALIDNWELLGAGAIEREERAMATLTMGIAHARRISLRTVDHAGAPLDVSFEGPASEAPIRRVVEACGQVLGKVAPPSPDLAPPADPATPPGKPS